MDTFVRSLWITVLFSFPVFLVILAVGRKRRVWREGNKAPFKELRRRPPGESLRVKIESFDERIGETLMLLAGVPVIMGMTGALRRVPDTGSLAIGFLFSLAWSGFFGRKLYRLVRDRTNYQLGFDGERFVGEELNRLIVEGFEIYHDLPFDGFNVDHVLVGPSGVFAVETKTRRKPINESGKKAFRVEFDGTCLRWPWGTNTRYVEQAANNARTVAEWLTGAVGQTVNVTPILALPGWLVDRTARSEGVYVVNPKEIVDICDSNRRRLSEELVRRINYQLYRKCKLEIN